MKLLVSCNQKLLGILFNNKFGFDEHVPSLCGKAYKKLNPLASVEHHMNLAERRSIINALNVFFCLDTLCWYGCFIVGN